VRDRVWKAFIALDGQPVPTGELVRRTWPRRQGPFNSAEYARVRAAAAELADRVGHVHRGRNSRDPGGWLAELDARGFLNENGRPFAAASVQAMLSE
jgi:hypothetical protein